MTVTACALALLLLTMPNIARRKEFRMVVLLIFMSIIYDVLWFMINNDVDDDDDGGVEKGVKRFARNISYISFVWKVSNQNFYLFSLCILTIPNCVFSF